MGFRKSTVIQYKTNPKTGKRVEVNRTVVKGKGTNAELALQANKTNQKPTALQNQRDAQIQRHQERMTNITGIHSNVANAITQASMTAQKAFENSKPLQSNVVNASTVDQLVNGGAQISSSVRDEDKDDDSEWVA